MNKWFQKWRKQPYSASVAPQTVDLEALRDFINPPERILSLEHLRSLITASDCYSVVERAFYERIVPIFEDLQANQVAGDLLVAGVWKGGSSLFLQGLNRHFHLNKKMWLADTFAGFIRESIQHDKDQAALGLFTGMLAANFPTPHTVRQLFENQGLWEDKVTILQGDLADTLPNLNTSALALIHLDVDFYEPTYAALQATYHKLQPGGYIIMDDYGVEMFNCKEAVEHFRAEHDITEPIHFMSNYIAYWKKTHHV